MSILNLKYTAGILIVPGKLIITSLWKKQQHEVTVVLNCEMPEWEI